MQSVCVHAGVWCLPWHFALLTCGQWLLVLQKFVTSARVAGQGALGFRPLCICNSGAIGTHSCIWLCSCVLQIWTLVFMLTELVLTCSLTWHHAHWLWDLPFTEPVTPSWWFALFNVLVHHLPALFALPMCSSSSLLEEDVTFPLGNKHQLNRFVFKKDLRYERTPSAQCFLLSSGTVFSVF